MWVLQYMIPEKIVQEYNIQPLFNNGRILAEIRKSMYGLPQAGRISYDALLPHLERGGYIPSKFTPGLFPHRSKPISICLIVDDFGVKYKNKEDAEELVRHLQTKYKTTVDWTGQNFCGMALQWDYSYSPISHPVNPVIRQQSPQTIPAR